MRIVFLGCAELFVLWNVNFARIRDLREGLVPIKSADKGNANPRNLSRG